MSIESLAGDVRRDRHGGKASQLGRALRAGLSVPPGFALSHEVVADVARNPAVHRERLAVLLRELDGPVAVRSSAVDEDGAVTSFAGVHATVLQQRTLDELIDGIVAVHASARTPAALAYRQRLGLSPEPAIAVVVQRMVAPRAAGVLFTRDPVGGRDVRVIEASWGLGEVVVNGAVEPDRIHMGRDGVVHSHVVGDKNVEIVVEGGIAVERAVDAARRRRPCLGAADLQALARVSIDVEQAFHEGVGHDVEFAIDDGGRLWLLQRREITR